MSRIGNKPITLPAGVTCEVDSGNVVKVKGPKGELVRQVGKEISVSIEDNAVKFTRPSDSKQHKALHGLYRSLVNNMIVGVHEGYEKNLELVGVGFKASAQGNVLELNLGYSHSIFMEIPAELKVEAQTPKGANPTVKLEGIDKELIGQVAAKIKSLRKVEPYKGKGVRFVGEHIIRKAGKAAAKK